MLEWLMWAGLWAMAVSAPPGTVEACVDALDGPRAVLVAGDGEVLQVPRATLPAGLREGDCMLAGANSAGLTRLRRDQARGLLRGLEVRGQAAGGIPGWGR
jgi:hypothetical protein